MALDPEAIAWLAAAAGLLAVAVWLLVLDQSSRVHQVLAIFLVIRALDWGLNEVFHAIGRSDAARLADALPNGPATFVLLWFLVLFPRPLPRVATSPLVPVAVATASIAYVATGLLFPQLVLDTSDWRPYDLGSVAMHALIAVAGCLLVRAFARGGRTDHLLLGLGFTLYEFDQQTGFLRNVGATPGYVGFYLDVLLAGRILTVAALVLTGALVYAESRSRRPTARSARVGVWVLVMAAALACVLEIERRETWAGIAGTLFAFAQPALIVYAVLHHSLFDLDVKVKWTLKRGTVAAVFLAVFFVVAQIAQNVLTDSQGLVVGGLAAGLMLFAIHPLQRAAERVADAAMPGVKDPRAVAATSGKVHAYRAALGMALADGVITRHEERALAKLARELGIDPETALDLREEAERAAPTSA